MALTEWGDGDLMIRDMATGETRQLVKGTCGPNSTICRFAEQWYYLLTLVRLRIRGTTTRKTTVERNCASLRLRLGQRPAC